MPTEGNPPPIIVGRAVIEATNSNCAKSKRGAVIFNPASNIVIASAHNEPPYPFLCGGKARCGVNCNKVAVHAEERAILIAQLARTRSDSYDLVHVKAVEGRLAPSGPPSCWQCSRMVAEIGLHVWLYEGTPVFDRECLSCSYVHSYRAASPESDLEHCPRCHTELEPLSKARYEHPATWRRYAPTEFHMVTLKNNGLGFTVAP